MQTHALAATDAMGYRKLGWVSWEREIGAQSSSVLSEHISEHGAEQRFLHWPRSLRIVKRKCVKDRMTQGWMA